MAQEAPVVHNRRLLVVAGVLGLIVVILYNVQMQAVRNSLQGPTVPVLRVTRDLQAGEVIKSEDLKQEELDSDVVASLGNVVKASQWVKDSQQTVNRPVKRNQFLLWADIVRSEDGNKPSDAIALEMETYTLRLLSESTPGDLIRVGDYVNVYGVFSINNKPPEDYLILRGARVLAVGGRGPAEHTGGARSAVDAGYRTISIEVHEAVGKQLDNLMSHQTSGAVRVALRSGQWVPTYQTPPGPQIEPELKSLITSAVPGKMSGSP